MKKRFQIIGLCFGWFGLISQLILSIQHRNTSIPEALIRYFSYFTILTNVLVALFFTAAVNRKNSPIWATFRSEHAMLAISTYIVIVGIIYHSVLSALWQPQGMQLLADQLLHTVMPIFMFLYWLFTCKAPNIQIKPLLSWLLYPIFYLTFVLISGHYTNFYPYPFLDVSQIGELHVFRNIAFISIGTLLMLLLFYVIGKRVKPHLRVTKSN